MHVVLSSNATIDDEGYCSRKAEKPLDSPLAARFGSLVDAVKMIVSGAKQDRADERHARSCRWRGGCYRRGVTCRLSERGARCDLGTGPHNRCMQR
jgi:hypothetical protein